MEPFWYQFPFLEVPYSFINRGETSDPKSTPLAQTQLMVREVRNDERVNERDIDVFRSVLGEI